MPSISLDLSVVHCKYPTTYVYIAKRSQETTGCRNEVFNPRCRVLIFDARTDTAAAKAQLGGAPSLLFSRFGEAPVRLSSPCVDGLVILLGILEQYSYSTYTSLSHLTPISVLASQWNGRFSYRAGVRPIVTYSIFPRVMKSDTDIQSFKKSSTVIFLENLGLQRVARGQKRVERSFVLRCFIYVMLQWLLAWIAG